MLHPSLSARLAGQLEALPTVLGDTRSDALTRRPAPGAWSAHENLAHLARHHEVMLERLRRIRSEEAPRLPRYRAEDDPDWPAWASRPTPEVLDRLRALRAELIETVLALSPEEVSRRGVHSAFGPLTVSEWLEFFLLHEAHHLYKALLLARSHPAP